ERKASAFQAVRAAVVDDEGRTFADSYVTAFFNFLEDDAFYRPVVVTKGTRAYLDAAQARPACGAASEIPVGTPVSDPLATHGGTVVLTRVFETDDEALAWAREKRNAREAQGWAALPVESASGSAM